MRQVSPAKRGTSARRRSDLGDRTHEDEGGDCGTEGGCTRRARSFERSGEKPGDERERGREDGVARQLVEEHDVPGIQEQGGGGRDGCGGTEASRDGAPGEDRERVENRGADLGDQRPGLEHRSGDERRSGRSRRERIRVDDVPVEELRVEDEVPPEVTPGRQWERDGDERVDRKCSGDERRGRSGPVGKPLE